MALSFTPEQERIFSSTESSLLINAYAGCAKTTTLVEYANRHPKTKFLYLAFNRAIRDEAAEKFPENTRCVTTHSLAYSHIGKLYKSKLANSLKPISIVDLFDGDMALTGFALDTVNRYIISSYKHIDERTLVCGELPRGQVLDAARKLWNSMCDPSEGAPMLHDGYLKLYHLMQKNIEGVDTIFFDEAQDANPLTLDIVERQPVKKIIVGDHYQSIYAFRGAVNAMTNFKPDAHYRLTTSFRFGDGIATLASGILYDWRGERTPLHGKGPRETRWQVDRKGPVTYIARTNAELFRKAVAVAYGRESFGYVGGIAGYRLDTIADAYTLSRGGRVRDPLLSRFKSWTSVVTYANAMDDVELRSIIRIMEEFSDDIPRHIQKIRSRATDHGNIMLTTAHKAKGLEWQNVILLDDFKELRIIDGTPPDPQEVNLIYVGVTRAIEALECNASLMEWIRSKSVAAKPKIKN